MLEVSDSVQYLLPPLVPSEHAGVHAPSADEKTHGLRARTSGSDTASTSGSALKGATSATTRCRSRVTLGVDDTG